jgi:flagellin-like protein
LNPHYPADTGSSSPLGTILMVMITIVLAALVLLVALQLPNLCDDPKVPTVFEITNIKHINQNGVDYDSYMVVKNSGKIAYDNRNLYAKTFRNGVHLPCDIPTMNGYDFIQVHPYGIQYLGGPGSDNYLWNPDALIAINYAKRTFHLGDIVQFEVYDRKNGQLLSRDTWPHKDDPGEKLMKQYISHQGA